MRNIHSVAARTPAPRPGQGHDLAIMSTAQQTRFDLAPGVHVHLVGIGGSGMSAIAWVLMGRGFRVSGSDRQRNQLTAELAAAGAMIYEGHAAEHIAGADLLVISSAVPAENPEVAAARQAGLPVLKRADLLGQLMVGMAGVAIAGTHGKTTTTSMIAHVLIAAGYDPSVIAGGILPELGRNGRAGESDLFVVEADEYDYMFHGLRPRLAVVTNIEHDHPDMFATADHYMAAFRDFVGLLPEDGVLVACSDDRGVRQLLGELALPPFAVLTYGLEAAARPEYRAVELRANALGGTDFVVLQDETTLGLARIRLPGVHNVRNALAAIAAAHTLGLSFGEIQSPLAEFGGVQRRFQLVGEAAGVTIIDDYAHHPTEIRVNLAAARERYPGRRLWAIWQPHTYSRTRLLLDDFAASFAAADRVIVLDIYPSRETDTLGMDARLVVEKMGAHPYVRHIGPRAEAAAYVLDRVRPEDVILTLGAGDGDQVGQWILDGLRERVPQDGWHRENG